MSGLGRGSGIRAVNGESLCVPWKRPFRPATARRTIDRPRFSMRSKRFSFTRRVSRRPRNDRGGHANPRSRRVNTPSNWINACAQQSAAWLRTCICTGRPSVAQTANAVYSLCTPDDGSNVQPNFAVIRTAIARESFRSVCLYRGREVCKTHSTDWWTYTRTVSKRVCAHRPLQRTNALERRRQI